MKGGGSVGEVGWITPSTLGNDRITVDSISIVKDPSGHETRVDLEAQL